VRPEERQLVRGQAPELSEFGGDDPGHAAHRCAGGTSGLPRSGHRAPEVEAFDRIREVAHEVAPTQLAVGEDIEPQLLLPGEDAEDVTVFDRPEALGVRRGGRVLRTCQAGFQ